MTINIKTILPLMIATSLYAQNSAIAYDGGIRLGVQYHDSLKSSRDVAIGGYLHSEGELYEGISLGGTFHTTQAFFGQHDAEGIPFFSSQARGYSILSEAYMKGEWGNTSAIFGRQILDTPFLDSDDIGMIPNSFEAYMLMNQDIKNSTILYSYVRAMSGVDSERAEKFDAINGGSGLHILGLSYEDEALSFSAWYYLLPHLASYSYLEVGYEMGYERFSYAFLAQAVLQEFVEAEDTKTLGFSASVSDERSALRATFAYNKSYGGVADNGFGGGPFFTSSENMTLADHSVHGEVFYAGVAWEASEALTLSLAKASLKDAKRHDGYEVDVVANYVASDTLSFDAIYSKIDNTDISGDKFDNVRVFANYTF